MLVGVKRKRTKLADRRRRDRQLKDSWRKHLRQSRVVTKSLDMDVSTDEENVDPTIENHSLGENRTRSSVHTIDRPSSFYEKPQKNTTTKTDSKKTASSKIKKAAADAPRKAAEVEEMIPASRNTKPKAIEKNPAGKTERKSNSMKAGSVTARRKNALGKARKKTDSTKARKSNLPKSNQIGILTGNKGKMTRPKPPATSTPVRK